MITSAIKSTGRTHEISRLWITLKYTFAIVPIVAGLDKFTNFLVEWSKYLNPDLQNALPFSPGTFMTIVGIIEIAAGFLVLFKTELGAYVVSAWLICIAISLLIGWTYPDVAVRDIVMAIAAFTLARLTHLKNTELAQE